MNPKVETRYIKLWIEDGILMGEYKEVDIDVAEAREVVETRIKFSENKSYPCLFDMRRLKSVSKEARAWFADEGAKYVTASALITGSAFTRTLADVFLIINKPPVPIKLFGNIPEAKKWLLPFVSGAK